jgi:hypothetical protein
MFTSLKNILQAFLPHRRRRMWKYVSAQRRRNGLILLAALVAMVYVGWFLTNDSRIRREARDTLESLTTADVDIERAQFSLFEGIRLHGVKVRIRESNSPEHFFTAREVVLKHNPWALLLRARLEPTEIVCLEPVVNLEYDRDSQTSNAGRLFAQIASQPRVKNKGPRRLPQITLRKGLLRSRVIHRNLRSPPVQKPFDGSLTPVDDHTYLVSVEEEPDGPDRAVQWARLKLDVETGQIESVSGALSDQAVQFLPPRYQEWIRRYNLSGEIEVVKGPETVPEEDRYKFRLRNFSLQLPPDQGGLKLQQVNGWLLFSREGVELREFRGRVTRAGDARFELDGRYAGFQADSPFTLRLKLLDFSLPENLELRENLAARLDEVRHDFSPQGRFDLEATLQRRADGTLDCEGTISPGGDATIAYHRFPLRVDVAGGGLWFNERGFQRIDLTGRRGSAAIRVAGTLTQHETFEAYSIDVFVRNAPFEEATRQALPERYQRVWDHLQPTGTTDLRVGVSRSKPYDQQEDPAIEVDFDMNGRTNLTYDGFPYPLRGLMGQVRFRDDGVTIDAVRSGRPGQGATLRVDGTIDVDQADRVAMDLSIQAQRVAIDETLRKAVGPKVGRFLDELHASGLARTIRAEVRARPGKEVDYDVAVELAEGAFRYEGFAYAIEQATGHLRIRPGRVELSDITGHHGPVKVSLNGWALLAVPTTFELNLGAKDVEFDADLAKALPPDARAIWDRLGPAGLADARATLSKTGDSAKIAYDITIQPRGMSLRYREVPYPLGNISGTVRLRRSAVELDVSAGTAPTKLTLAGTIRMGRPGQIARLAMTARDLPVDEDLLSAVPEDLAPLLGHMRKGGTLGLNLPEIVIQRKNPKRAPGAEPLSKTLATRPAVTTKWQARGTVQFNKVTADLGLGERTLTGKLTGLARMVDGNLALQADAALDSFTVRDYLITAVKGRLTKLPDRNWLHIDNIEARSLGGRVIGRIDLHLGEPMRYKLSAEVAGIDLDKLVNAGLAANDPRRTSMIGRLDGVLSMEVVGGKTPSRQASGELTISKAKLYKLPVILGLLNVIYLTVPGDSAFNRGSMNYHLRDETLFFREIFLTGQTLSVLGTGKLNMGKETLDLTFLTGPPGMVVRIDNLTTELLDALSKELLEVRVGGTLAHPEMTTHTLRSLERILKRLIPPPLEQ